MTHAAPDPIENYYAAPIDYSLGEIVQAKRPATSISPKVSGGLAAGAVATIVVFIAQQFGLVVPTGVEGAIATLVGFVAGYIVPDNR